MPVRINGQKYFRTAEVCRETGISKATLFRWLNNNIIEQSNRDRRGWRLFTKAEMNAIRKEANKVHINYLTRGS